MVVQCALSRHSVALSPPAQAPGKLGDTPGGAPFDSLSTLFLKAKIFKPKILLIFAFLKLELLGNLAGRGGAPYFQGARDNEGGRAKG